jgi:flagellar motility protein MotE (MotC chaperone)
MRTLWQAVSFLAIVNLLALALLAGWLYGSGRLNRERVLAIRETLAPTIEEAQAAAEAAAAEAAAVEQAEAEAARRANPPLASEAHLSTVADYQRANLQAEHRMAEQAAQLRADLEAQMAQLERERDAFEAERTAWRESIREEHDQRSDKQFQKAVKLYESVKPALAKDWLMNLIEDGESGQVVAYLNAMNTRGAKKILEEFKGEADGELAAQLLEDLRTLGLNAGLAGETSDDDLADAGP